MTPQKEKNHAGYLLMMLEEDNPCEKGNCPARQSNLGPNYPCYRCKEFLDIPKEKGLSSCPCWSMPKAEAIKLTWLALEAKGYLEDSE